jgi:SAM-dependent methyltransferase
MKLYRELAEWWQLFSPVEEYSEEAASFIRILRENCEPSCRTILELGAGAGGNAFYLKKEFAMTLVDLSPEMLAESRKINSELEHLAGDMRDIRLNRQFDAVFIHDAICYMRGEEDLRRTIETAFVHCKPGGATVIAPDYVRETFKPSTEQGGRDGDVGTENENRALRWLMWTFDPNLEDATYAVHFAFLLKKGEVVSLEHDYHAEGLFARGDWLRLFGEAGFEPPKIIVDLYDREVFVARKPEP